MNEKMLVSFCAVDTCVFININPQNKNMTTSNSESKTNHGPYQNTPHRKEEVVLVSDMSLQKKSLWSSWSGLRYGMPKISPYKMCCRHGDGCLHTGKRRLHIPKRLVIAAPRSRHSVFLLTTRLVPFYTSGAAWPHPQNLTQEMIYAWRNASALRPLTYRS